MAHDGFEGALARACELLERPLIKIDDERANRGVELCEREELPIAHPHENPALDHEHAIFYGGLGVERALHMVTNMARKFLPCGGRIRSVTQFACAVQS